MNGIGIEYERTLYRERKIADEDFNVWLKQYLKRNPWMTAFSKTNQKLYLFNTRKNFSSFEKVDEANANFRSCFSGRIFWSWEKGVQLIEEQNIRCDNSLVQGQALANFVRRIANKMTGR
ncbi:cap-specific mRNA-methyltransferase 1 [Trichonephila clavata]|uniref:Cap-specific mRNA-methyltransferase 1 n=1 Tax=Trichonephila clavata TaxID=2740835 RepID=A0A8X6LXA5_TRICU|nr:cap-specific mRNA-methyltransferase 1 [Trichonephila clavata]